MYMLPIIITIIISTYLVFCNKSGYISEALKLITPSRLL